VRFQSTEAMTLVNRSVVILRPKQPYRDWANSFSDGPRFVEEPGGESGTAFLVPEFATLEEIQGFVVANSEFMFEHELDAWQDAPETWPRDRSFTALQDWFDVQIHSLVIDLGEGPIEVDEA
jgi:hypothetical protein